MRAPIAVLLLAGAFTTKSLAAQTQAQQPDFKWEKALGADMSVSLHNISGNITVSASTSGKVEITGNRRRGRDADEMTIEVVEHSRGITACAMDTRDEMDCDEDGLHGRTRRRGRDRDWDNRYYMDMDVRLPKGMRLQVSNVSGDVRITGVEGTVRGGSVSGDVRIEVARATSVRASSVSGEVTAIIVSLAGEGPLEFSSVSGNVIAELPKGLDADVSMRSVSGSLDSDFPLTLNGRVNRSRIEARIGKGGRELEVHTVSGDVHLRTARP
jgi:DUF4097 and DUF4098 domain-containing protein YvlB